MRAALLLPVIPSSEEDILHWRRNMASRLDDLLKDAEAAAQGVAKLLCRRWCVAGGGMAFLLHIWSCLWLHRRRRFVFFNSFCFFCCLLPGLRAPLNIRNPVTDVEHMHFHLTYHGRNDRILQERISQVFVAGAPGFASVAPEVQGRPWPRQWLPRTPPGATPGSGRGDDPMTTPSAPSPSPSPSTPPTSATPVKRIRVGFFSKFFHENHAHGQLLQGIMAGLPREHFEVVLLHLATTRDRGHVSADIAAAIDEDIPLPLHAVAVRAEVIAARLDVLVFADTTSEPLAWTLSLGRMAPIQMAFWGNPSTTGHGDTLDYFISGDAMEVCCFSSWSRKRVCVCVCWLVVVVRCVVTLVHG